MVGANDAGVARRHVRVAGSSTTAVPTTQPPETTTTEPTTTTATTVAEAPEPLALSSSGVGYLAFDGPFNEEEGLFEILGPPTSVSEWAYDNCVQKQLRYLRWDALEIRLSDDGSGARLDGWALDQALGAPPPAGVVFTPAITFTMTWPQLQALGAVWHEDLYGWSIAETSVFGHLSTELPSDSSTVTAFGAGKTRLLHC